MDNSDTLDTLYSDDLRTDPAVSHPARSVILPNRPVEDLQRENDRLTTENYLLRRQVYMVQENSSLKIANVLATILSWFDENYEQQSVSSGAYAVNMDRQVLLNAPDSGHERSRQELIDESSPMGYSLASPQVQVVPELLQDKKDQSTLRTSDLATTREALDSDRNIQTGPLNTTEITTQVSQPPADAEVQQLSLKITPKPLDQVPNTVLITRGALPKELENRTTELVRGDRNNASTKSCDPWEDCEISSSDSDSSMSKRLVHHPADCSEKLASDGRPCGYVWERKSSPMGNLPAKEGSQSVASNNTTGSGQSVGPPLAASTPEDKKSLAVSLKNLDKTPQKQTFDNSLELPRRDVHMISSTTSRKMSLLSPPKGPEDVEAQRHLPLPFETITDNHATFTPTTSGKGGFAFEMTPKTPQTVIRKPPVPPNKVIKSNTTSSRPRTNFRGKTKIAASLGSPTNLSATTGPNVDLSSTRDTNKNVDINIAYSSTRPRSANRASAQLAGAQTPKHSSGKEKSLSAGSKSEGITNNNNTMLETKQPSISMQAAAILKLKPTTRLMGEIAFQMDRRILSYIFRSDPAKYKRRFYGYIIQNIPEMIIKESTDHVTGLLDGQVKYLLQYRYKYIVQSLAPFGYDMSIHPEFAADMVNKYGLLPLSSEGAAKNVIGPDCRRVLRDLITQICPAHELRNVLILLDCLALMSRDDGKPLFVF